MRKKLTTAIVATVAAVSMFLAGSAGAATSYSNCDQLHRRFYKYGVARSVKAANYQYRTGHNRPRVNLNVYRANTRLDADKDGTACEVTR